jgi:hypothetical protein
MKLIGAREAQIVPGDKLQGTLNSFIGNDPTKWQTKISTYSQVKYQGIYSGVDLIYYGNQQQLEYDFIVAPGADPAAIRFGIGGAESRIDSNGELVMHTSLGDVHQHKPVIYQEIAGVRHPVNGGFVKLSNGQVGFSVADYDRTQGLTIDPMFGFSTYLGGSGVDQGLAIAVDNLGDTYVGGTTASTNYPTNGSYAGPYPTYPAGATAVCIQLLRRQHRNHQRQRDRTDRAHRPAGSVRLCGGHHHGYRSADSKSPAGFQRRRQRCVCRPVEVSRCHRIFFLPGRQRKRNR